MVVVLALVLEYITVYITVYSNNNPNTTTMTYSRDLFLTSSFKNLLIWI